MPRNILALLLALSLPLSASAAEREYFVASATGTLTVAPDGTVVDVDLGRESALGSDVVDIYDELVRSWRFQPVIVDGKPAQVLAHMRLSLVASREKGDEQTEFGVRDVWFLEPPAGPGREATGASSDLQPPIYPSRALQAGAGAEMLLLLELGEDGQVVRVGTEKVNMLGVPQGKKAAVMARWMSHAAESKAASWRLEAFAGRKVRVPVSFNVVREGWQRMYPFDAEPDPWVLAALAEDDITDIAAGGGTPARLELQSDLPAIPGLDDGG